MKNNDNGDVLAEFDTITLYVLQKDIDKGSVDLRETKTCPIARALKRWLKYRGVKAHISVLNTYVLASEKKDTGFGIGLFLYHLDSKSQEWFRNLSSGLEVQPTTVILTLNNEMVVSTPI